MEEKKEEFEHLKAPLWHQMCCRHDVDEHGHLSGLQDKVSHLVPKGEQHMREAMTQMAPWKHSLTRVPNEACQATAQT